MTDNPVHRSLQASLDWLLPIYRCVGPEDLLANMQDKVVAPAETKVSEVRTPSWPGRDEGR